MLRRLLIPGPPHRGIPTRLKRAVYRAVVLVSPAAVDVSFPQPPVEVIEWEAKDVVEFQASRKKAWYRPMPSARAVYSAMYRSIRTARRSPTASVASAL